MGIDIREESPKALAEYSEVPIAFRVQSLFRAPRQKLWVESRGMGDDSEAAGRCRHR